MMVIRYFYPKCSTSPAKHKGVFSLVYTLNRHYTSFNIALFSFRTSNCVFKILDLSVVYNVLDGSTSWMVANIDGKSCLQVKPHKAVNWN